MFDRAYQPAIQQCFSFATNQRQPESTSQKQSSEQEKKKEAFQPACRP
jgi:hypothetical protein